MVYKSGFLKIPGVITLAAIALFASKAAAQSPHIYEFPPLIIAADEEVPGQPTYLNPAVPADSYNYIITEDGVYSTRDPMELRELIPPARNTGSAWKIYKTEWDEADERGYEAFVTSLGRTKCASIDECLRDPANPYRDLEDDTIYLGDCADMAYFLRGYYAWKNGLPWSYQDAMRTANGAGEDPRYSSAGNIVASRRSVITRSGSKPVNAPGLLRRIRGEVSTAMFRTHPVTGAPEGFDDFYPVAIDREHVVPGSIVYDVYGHVGLVYEVEEDGRVMIFSSHPDFSISRTTYGANFMRTGPEFGGGLKAWRPIRLVGATKTSDGSYVGGRIVATANEDLPGFSMVQYVGNGPEDTRNWSMAEFQYENRVLNYYEFVRRSLADPDYAFDPIRELRNAMTAICGDLKARKVAVDAAVREGVHLKDAPERLPENIYGTYGTWESFSTPSRDARLKTAFRELRWLTEDLITKHRYGQPGVDYTGNNLTGDLLNAFDDEKKRCQITYQRMDRSTVVLNMNHIMDRLFDLSFDPYHCPERRWGAKGKELATCQETPEKAAWYDAQKYLRNQVERTYSVRMNFRQDELKSPLLADVTDGGLGAVAPPDIHIKKYLMSQVGIHRSEEGDLGKGIAGTESAN
ncbi:hypothetical protein [Parvularcula sp. IMCC14364]|uniref:hypothetical protein n=1 Tax=Parvularcula sp. IMCC14364 TaxID=3067902 RepID=UPI00274054B7|nr:hypothetical protein [Parvularcula sp. IMCC14364]